MSIRTQKLIYLLLFIPILFGLFAVAGNIVVAQSIDTDTDTDIDIDIPPAEIIVIATVNIYNASIDSQDGNVFNISFDIFNREGAQPQVKYGIQLLEEFEDGGQAIIDTKIFSEEINLGENTTVHREVVYQAPEFLDGTYQLWVLSENAKGLPLALSMVGEVELKSTRESVEILVGSCFLQVEGEKDGPSYSMLQGVDIDLDERIIATCDVISHFNTDISFAPAFKTLYRSQFGEEVEHIEGKQQVFTLESGEQTSISFFLPRAEEPQAYDVNAVFKDMRGNDLSNTVVAHYVLRGPSATIQNLTLDKNSYRKGDTAIISFSGSLAADAFPDSRNEQFTVLEGVVSVIQIVDEKGEACAPEITNPLTSSDILNEFQVTITKNCYSPVVTASIEDSDGKVLDTVSFVFSSDESTDGESVGIGKTSMFMTVAIVILIILIISVLALLNKRKAKDSIVMSILFLIVFSGVFFITPQSAQADTFIQYTPDIVAPQHFTIKTIMTVNLNKSSFIPNETINISASAKSRTCGNNRILLTLTADHNGVDIATIINYLTALQSDITGATKYWVPHSGSGTLAAPSSPGNYIMKFIAKVRLWHVVYGWTKSSSGSYNMPFSVVPPPPLSATCLVSPPTEYVDNLVTWTANAADGYGSYTYVWTGTDGLSGTTAAVNKTYSSIGTKTGQVTVQSGSEEITVSCSNSATITPIPQCSDGDDNDGDTYTDYPADIGCTSLSDDDETDPPQCSDGIDNDEDTYVDHPADPGCTSISDDDETDLPQCSDSGDNDGDERIDAGDPGCYILSTCTYVPTDDIEDDDLPQCSNCIDDDGDGFVDYEGGAGDPGCSSASDDREFSLDFREF